MPKEVDEHFMEVDRMGENFQREIQRREQELSGARKELEEEKARNHEMQKRMKKFNQMKKLAVVFAGVGLFLISSNFTGYSVFNLNSTNSNWIGIALFILGLVGIYFWSRNS